MRKMRFASLVVVLIDYTSGDGATLFKYDVLMQGPVLGFVFKF
jgi:hypothetical protein